MQEPGFGRVSVATGLVPNALHEDLGMSRLFPVQNEVLIIRPQQIAHLQSELLHYLAVPAVDGGQG